ncbi:MAG TPA: hypothetical protein VJR48_13100, partial [Ktedonobacterales bacterium]|nr:hypothetical protein [Ktedonobacterales bacterium]
LISIISRRHELADRPLALAGGASIGLAIGLVGGIGFLALQSRTGGPDFSLAPYEVRVGLLCGLGLGLLAALAVGAIAVWRSISAGGMLLGTLAGLGIFRLIFGPTAGFGGEVGLGVGHEVGIMFGAAGGLLGAILAAVILLVAHPVRARSAATDTPVPARRGWRWPLLGLAVGAVVAALIAVLGAQLGIFQFLVPYNGQVPDVPPDTSPVGLQHDFLFGLGMFAVGGALIGCLLSLHWALSSGDDAWRHGVWLGAGMVIALLCGLSFGLDHRYVGGPLLATQFQIAQDPAASMRGLVIGLVSGMALGVLLLVGARIGRTHARWQTVARMVLALIVGLLLITLAYWFTPIFAINIY